MSTFSSPLFRSALFFLLAPLLVLLLVRTDLNQAGGLDAFVYAAYIHDYADLVARYGRTYYSTRLSHILPNAVAASLFGDYAGYYLVRYLLLVTAMVSIHTIARRYVTTPAAWFVTLFFSTHVWLLREVFWDHYDGSVVVFALAGVALLQPRSKETLAHAGAGFAFAWAANGNPMGLLIAATFIPTWLMDRRNIPWRELLRSVSAAGAGFLFGYSVLIFAMTRLYPDGGWRFDEVTLSMLSYLLTGGGTNWFKSLKTILLDLGIYETLIFPFFLGISVCGLLAGLRGSVADRRNVIGAAIFIALTTAVFAIFHFILQWGLLSLHFYLIYALPACLVATSAFIGQLRPEVGAPRIAIVAAIFLVFHFAFWFSIQSPFPVDQEIASLLRPLALSMIVVAFISMGWLAVVIARQNRTLTPAILFLVALFSSNAFFLHSGYARLYSDTNERQLEWDVRDGSLYLQRFVAAHVPTKSRIWFWYGPRDKFLNSVQSAHLWGFSRLSSPALSDAQMPVIDGGVRERLGAAQYLAILGTDTEIDQALGALENAGIGARLLSRGEFHGQQWPGYRVVLVALKSQ